ncbi:MAG: hypothetical protein H6739_36795 [Alphaproteobacteria bacterium]|nr:hypothetical protein [Alphaproteobacteria bacterium]
MVQVLTVWNVACGVSVTLFALLFMVNGRLPDNLPLWLDALSTPFLIGWLVVVPFTSIAVLIANYWVRWRPATLLSLLFLVLWPLSILGMFVQDHSLQRPEQEAR